MGRNTPSEKYDAIEIDEEASSEREIVADRGSEPGRSEALLAEYLRALAGSLHDAGVKARALHDLGVIEAAALGDPDAALASHREAWALRPEAPYLVRALRKAARRAERWDELAAACEREACLTTDPEQRGALLQARGRLLERRLGDVEAARRAHLAALEADLAIVLALEALERLAEARSDWREASELAERLASAVGAPLAQAEALARAARHDERVGELGRAEAHAAAALAAAPAGPGAWAVLERLLAGDDRLSDLMALREAEIASEVVDAPAAWLDVGIIARFRLGHDDKALTAFARAARSLEPACRATALDQLSAILRKRGEWGQLVEVERERAGATQDPAGRAAAWHRVAILEERRRGNDEAALQAYERALEEHPGWRLALDGAGRICARTGQHDRLVRMHLRAGEACPEGERSAAAERAAWAFAAADVLAWRLDEPERALELLREAAALAPDDAAIRAALVDLLDTTGRWGELRALLAAEEAPGDAATRLRRAMLAEAVGGDDALELYRHARVCGVRAAAFPILRLLTARGEWAQLVTHFTSGSRTLLSPAHAAYRAAEHLSERLGDRAAAVEALRGATSGADASVACCLAALRLADDAGRRAELRRAVAAASGDERLARAHLSEAALELDDLGKRAEALEVRLDLADRGVRDPVLDVELELGLEAAGRRDRLVEALRSLADSAGVDREVRAALWSEVATLVDARAEPRAAIDALSASMALEAETPSLAVRIGLARAARAAGDVVQRARALRTLAEALPPGAERATAWRALARHVADEGGSLDAAISACESALEARPTDRASLRVLASLLERKGDRLAMIAPLRRAFSAEREPAPIAATGAVLAARLLQADRPEEAREVLDRVRAAAPDDPKASMLVAELGLRSGEARGAAEALEAIAGRDDAPDELRREARRLLDRSAPAAGLDDDLPGPGSSSVVAGDVRLRRDASARSPARAIAFHCAEIERQPERLESYHALRELYAATGDEDAVFCVEAALVGLQAADEAVASSYRRRAERLPTLPTGTVGADDLRRLCPERDAPALSILKAFEGAFASALPLDVETAGLPSAGEAGCVEAAASTRSVARLFGLGEVGLAVIGGSAGPTIEIGPPYLLVLPRDVVRGDLRRQLCVSGALLGRAAVGGALVDVHRAGRGSPRTLAYALAAACELLVPGYAPPFGPSAVYDDLKARLDAVATQELRAAASPLAERLAVEAEIDAAALVAAVARASARAGVLAAMDPAAAVEALRARGSSLSPDAGSGPRGPSAAVLAALAFAVSTDHIELRRRLGLGVAP